MTLTWLFGVVVLAGEGALGALFAQDVVLRRRQLGAPFGVAFLDLVGHAQSLVLKGPFTRQLDSSSATARRPSRAASSSWAHHPTCVDLTPGLRRAAPPRRAPMRGLPRSMCGRRR